MVSSTGIAINIIGLIVSLYGGLANDLTLLVIGIIIILLNITFGLNEVEENVRILKAQINTQNELKRMQKEIDDLKNEK